MSDEDFLRYQRRIVTWVIYAVIASIVSSVGINQGIQGVTTFRHDPFTGRDAQRLRQDCRAYVDNRFEVHSKMIPPENTRKRIRYIEAFLQRKYDYMPPSYDWAEE